MKHDQQGFSLCSRTRQTMRTEDLRGGQYFVSLCHLPMSPYALNSSSIDIIGSNILQVDFLYPETCSSLTGCLPVAVCRRFQNRFRHKTLPASRPISFTVLSKFQTPRPKHESREEDPPPSPLQNLCFQTDLRTPRPRLCLVFIHAPPTSTSVDRYCCPQMTLQDTADIGHKF